MEDMGWNGAGWTGCVRNLYTVVFQKAACYGALCTSVRVCVCVCVYTVYKEGDGEGEGWRAEVRREGDLDGLQ